MKYILLSTVFRANENPDGPHYKTEEAVRNSGIGYTIVRPNFIFQNFINYDLEAVKSHG